MATDRPVLALPIGCAYELPLATAAQLSHTAQQMAVAGHGLANWAVPGPISGASSHGVKHLNSRQLAAT